MKKCWTQSATCCRECIRKWHKMYPEKELSQVQQDYLVDVIMTWIQKEIEGQEHKIRVLLILSGVHIKVKI